jgi:hypothetical protein
MNSALPWLAVIVFGLLVGLIGLRLQKTEKDKKRSSIASVQTSRRAEQGNRPTHPPEGAASGAIGNDTNSEKLQLR